MPNILGLKEFLHNRCRGGGNVCPFLFCIPALSLLLADASLRITLPASILWAAVLLYMGRAGRFAEAFTALCVLWLYIGAESITYGTVPKSVFAAYLTCSVALAFGLAGVRQLARGKHGRLMTGPLTGAGVFVIALPALFCLCHYIIFKAVIPPDAFYAIGQTNMHEAWQFFRQNIGLHWAVLFLGVSGALMFFYSLERKGELVPIPFSLIAVILLLSAVNMAVTQENLNLITKIRLYAVQYAEEMESFKQAQAQKKSQNNLRAVKKETGETVLLVIGEAHNKRHMRLYGYQRETTPKLDVLYKGGDILRFDQVYPSHTHTMQTLSLALTQADLINDKKYFESPTIIDIARAAGYETHWISNQALFGPWDNLVAIVAKSAGNLVPLNRNIGENTDTHNFDGTTVAELEKILAQKTDKNRFIVVHLMGSHGDYCERYPQSFKKYDGSLPIGEFGKKLQDDKLRIREINCYDNSVLYNDTVVSDLISALKKNSGANFMLYFSDHSEDPVGGVGHNSSQFTYEMSYIPMIFWASDQYKARHAAAYKAMKSATQTLFGNEHIYDTLIGLMKIDTKWVNTANDLSSPSYNADRKPSYMLYKQKQYASDENRMYWLQQVQKALAAEGQDARIVVHRVDTTGKLADMQAVGLNSFEIDLYYNPDSKRFDVGHDSKVMAGKTFDEFLARAPQGEFDKIWLDLKNITVENLDGVIAELDRLKARDFAIVESSLTDPAFAKASAAGYSTSYYLPTQIEDITDADELKKRAEDIAGQVANQKIGAVSFDISLYPFVKKYLEPKLGRDVVYHTWDTDLNMGDKKFLKRIKAKDYYGDKRIKTILVSFPSDYNL